MFYIGKSTLKKILRLGLIIAQKSEITDTSFNLKLRSLFFFAGLDSW